MEIQVNGELRSVAADITVSGLLQALGVHEGPVAVERNRHIVPRAEHATTVLSAGDVLEVVHFVGGG